MVTGRQKIRFDIHSIYQEGGEKDGSGVWPETQECLGSQGLSERESGTYVMVKVLTFPFTDCYLEVMSPLRTQFPQLENGNNRTSHNRVLMKKKQNDVKR